MALIVGMATGVLLAGGSISAKWILFGLIALAALLYAIRSARNAFLLAVLLLPLQSVGVVEFGLSLRLSEILFILAFLLLIWRDGFHPPRTPLALPLAAFLLISGISIIQTLIMPPPFEAVSGSLRSLPVRGIIQFFALLLMATIYYVTVCLVFKRPGILWKAWRGYLSVAVVVALYGCYQIIARLFGFPFADISTYELAPQAADSGWYSREVGVFVPRARSTFLEPLNFANYLLAPMSIFLSVFMSARDVRSGRGRVLVAIGLFILLSAIYLTFSLGGYLGAIVAIVVVLMATGRSAFRSALLVSLLVALAIGSMALISGGLDSVESLIGIPAGRLRATLQYELGGEEAYGISRLSMFRLGMKLFLRSPLLGVGLGNFGFYGAQYQGADVIVSQLNVFAQTLSETGVLGFLAYLWLVGSVAVFLWRGYRRRPKGSLTRAVLAGSLAGFLGMLAQFMTYAAPRMEGYAWVFMGLAIATAMDTDNAAILERKV